MVEIAVAVLRLPDGRIVFQRRGIEAPTSAGLLGLFGGHVEPEDTGPHQTIIRELDEEISLDIASLSPQYINSFEYDADVGKGPNHYKFSAYEVAVPTEKFEVYEGVGSEVYTRDEALTRDDLTISARHILEELVKE